MFTIANDVRTIDALQRRRQKDVAGGTDEIDIRSFGAENAERFVDLALRERGDDDARRFQLANRFARHLQTDHAGATEDEKRVRLDALLFALWQIPALGDALVREPALAIERGLAAGSRRGHRLTIDVIDDVATRED